jgi:hypothetical protein
MLKSRIVRVGLVLSVIVAAAVGTSALRTEAAAGGNHCPRGVKKCSASQVGQPCDPNNLNIICAAQANGSYCCLAYAP